MLSAPPSNVGSLDTEVPSMERAAEKDVVEDGHVLGEHPMLRDDRHRCRRGAESWC